METLLDIYKFYISRPAALPMNFIVYNTLLFICVAYAYWRGGAPERLAAAIVAIGSILSLALVRTGPASFQSVETGVLIVDLACAAAFIMLALRADRYWPFWVAALQLNGTAAHMVRLLDHEIFRGAYAFLLAIWSYPMLLIIIIGTARHRKRLSRDGGDRDWSASSANRDCRPA